ncbi:Calmodulin and related proteins (EF-Hand superfamily) [Handroanthus impetiginosus]|uniref:Calmodulin and related proteins (EF-Hand superfamily) n=1 Tax=Handroanthus impetiginosus TaxID=429701 RepID=A0A2G9HE68_9LAMI|nr:Calmodulin and related proteins (EF-Hand superfamily) [Handroanthus impetiginosus]
MVIGPKIFNLCLPFKGRSKPPPEMPPPETTPGGGGSNGIKEEGEFRKVFSYLDANNDGKISADELSASFSSIGDDVSIDKVEKIIREFSNGGATEDSLLLDFEAFERMMDLRDSEDDKVLQQAFEVYVEEKGGARGCITPEGLRRVLGRLGDVKSYEECEAMIRVFDLDGDGVLDYNEFQKMMMT